MLNPLCFASETPHEQIHANIGLSDSSPKSGDLAQLDDFLPDLQAALVASAGTGLKLSCVHKGDL
jgi:hypothetical protein